MGQVYFVRHGQTIWNVENKICGATDIALTELGHINIDFYSKSGFRQASEYGIRYHGLPEGEDASFFLCKELVPGYLDGITGEYATPESYLVDEREAEEFDKQFPYKEKKVTVNGVNSNYETDKNLLDDYLKWFCEENAV